MVGLLERHIGIHTREKRYMGIHTRDPFSCSICDQSFSVSGSLKRQFRLTLEKHFLNVRFEINCFYNPGIWKDTCGLILERSLLNVRFEINRFHKFEV